MTDHDLVRALADLDGAADGPELARRALELCVGATGATLGWLAFGADPADPSWTAVTGPDAELARRASAGVVAEALTSGRLVVTTDASRDPRFQDRESVRRSRLEVVVCAPVGRPAVGVLYLQGGPAPTPERLALVSLVARLVAPYARESLWSDRWESDPTRAPRARLPARGLVGRSPAVGRLLEQLGVVAPTRIPVLLQGPSGVGKTLVARALHEAGPCADGPFVVVDATLLHRERAAADLFGARRGSWTGLTEDRAGFFEVADGGTLFLDEVGDLPLDVQPQLLTALEGGRFHRVGETRERRTTVRLVAATHVDLERRIAEGTFRADLVHRLAGFRVRVPALAERRGDVGLIAAAVIDREAAAWGLRALPLTPAAVGWLEQQPWPGNVRELANVVRGGLLWANTDGADAIGVRHLTGGEAPEPEPVAVDDLRAAVRAFRGRHVARVLAEEGGSVTRAAKRLGVHRAHLHELLREVSAEGDTGPGASSEEPDTSGS